MIKIVQTPDTSDNVVEMKDMKPLQVGQLVETQVYGGHWVMRTARMDSFEVMDLSDSGAKKCWVHSPNLQVRLLKPGEKLTIELSNEC